MILSILICTLPERAESLKRLTNILQPQLTSEVEIKLHDAGRSMSTGEKRNQLIENCNGDYFCFIDDDDWVPMYYVDELKKAINQNPDVITFNGWMTTDGQRRENFVIKLNERYEQRNGVYYRYPNHLCCFKKSVVEGTKFMPIYVREDYEWATAIHNRKLLKSEVHIDLDMYHYQFSTKKNNAHYKSPRVR